MTTNKNDITLPFTLPFTLHARLEGAEREMGIWQRMIEEGASDEDTKARYIRALENFHSLLLLIEKRENPPQK